VSAKRSRGGFREDIGIYVRSSWEHNYALYLNFLMSQRKIKSWEYEPDTFEFEGIKRGCRFYTPDFKVVHPDGRVEYHEIKGYMDKRSATKLKRMAKYHPDVVVKIIDESVYGDLARIFRNVLSGWEK